MADTDATDAEKAAAEALANASAPEGQADPPAEPEQDPAAVPTLEEQTQPAPQNTISDVPSTHVEGPEDPGVPTLEEATASAEEAAQTTAEVAAENRPEPEAVPEPQPEEDVPTAYVVYQAVEGQIYPGRFLTITIKLEGDEDGNPVLDTITLEEGVPTLLPTTHADAAAAYADETDNFVIKSAT